MIPLQTKINSHISHVMYGIDVITRERPAAVWVVFWGFVTINTQTLVRTISVYACLTAGESGGAFINVNTAFPIILQVKSWPALTLDTWMREKRWWKAIQIFCTFKQFNCNKWITIASLKQHKLSLLHYTQQKLPAVISLQKLLNGQK